jgi:hypothetical protein
MKSIGDIVVDDIKSDVAYVKEREKQAQIIGPLTRRTHDRMNLKLLQEIDVTIGNPHYYHSMSHDLCIHLNCIQRKVLSRYLRWYSR